MTQGTSSGPARRSLLGAAVLGTAAMGAAGGAGTAHAAGGGCVRGGRPAFRDLIAVRHPADPFDAESGTGLGRRLLFQRVPEPKTVKNRMHLDIETPDVSAEAARLEGLGARRVQAEEMHEHGTTWIVMADPEGNEFCVCDSGAGSASR